MIAKCPDCGATVSLRKSWYGPAPIGAIRCDCGAILNLAEFVPAEFASDDPQPSLHDAYEDLLGAVYAAEADWRLMDRIDLAVRR